MFVSVPVQTSWSTSHMTATNWLCTTRSNPAQGCKPCKPALSSLKTLPNSPVNFWGFSLTFIVNTTPLAPSTTARAGLQTLEIQIWWGYPSSWVCGEINVLRSREAMKKCHEFQHKHHQSSQLSPGLFHLSPFTHSSYDPSSALINNFEVV